MIKRAFQSNSKFKFLEEVAQIAINNSAHDFTKLKILLPTGLACSELQKILVTRLGTCILPKIIPISELIAESEEIFKIPSEQVGSISRLEENVTLAITINDYKPLGYDLVQSLRLSPSLANLFFELEANNINLEEIKQLPVLDVEYLSSYGQLHEWGLRQADRLVDGRPRSHLRLDFCNIVLLLEKLQANDP